MSTTATPAEAAAASAQEPLSSQQKMAVARAARAFGSYGEAKKTMAKIAKAIVSLRLTFEKDGRPDYRGETPQYRGAIASLYQAAIPDETEREAFKVAIRYWVAKEFTARVESGALDKAALAEAGLQSAQPARPTPPPAEPEPRRAATAAQLAPTGVIVNGDELTPPEVLVEAERIVAEHATSDALGVVMALQSLGRALGPLVAALRDDEVRTKLPGRSLRAAVETVMSLTLDAATLCDIDVEEFVAAYFARVEDEQEAAAAAAAKEVPAVAGVAA